MFWFFLEAPLLICLFCEETLIFLYHLSHFYMSNIQSNYPLMQLFKMEFLRTESFWLNFDKNFACFQYALKILPTYFVGWFQAYFSSLLN